MLRDGMMAAELTRKKNSARFINKLEWKKELLQFQILGDKKGRFDLKIECLDGYFLAHKMVFTAFSEITWSDKRNGIQEKCVVMNTVEEVAKIVFLAYTGEYFFKDTPPYLDGLIKAFQIIQDKLSWGMPYYINGRSSSSHSLTLRKVRACRKSVITGTMEDVYIYEDGSVIAVRDSTTIETSENVLDIGHACDLCSCIFMEKIQLEEHKRNCRPLVTVKSEILSPPLSVTSEKVNESSSTVPSYQQEFRTPTKPTRAISPEETVCSCGHKTTTDKKLVEHYNQIHDIKPTMDYSTRPFKKCKRCPFNQKGIPLSTFLNHVLNCKAAAGYNSLEFLDCLLQDGSTSTFDPLLLQTPVDKKKGYNTPKKSNGKGKKVKPKEVNKKTSVNKKSSKEVSNIGNTNIGEVRSRQLLENTEMPFLEHYNSTPPREIIANKNVDASNQPLKKSAPPIKKINFTQVYTRATSNLDGQRDNCNLNVNTNQSKDGAERNEFNTPKKKDDKIHPPESASLNEPTIIYSTFQQNTAQVHPQSTSLDDITDRNMQRCMRPQTWKTPLTTTAPIIMTSNESELQRTLKRKLSSSPHSDSDTTKLIKLRPWDTPRKERLTLGKAFSPPSNLNRFPLGGHNKKWHWSCNFCKKQFDEQVSYMRHSCHIPMSCPN